MRNRNPEVFWNAETAADVRGWAKEAKAANPAEAVATLWNAWQQENDPATGKNERG